MSALQEILAKGYVDPALLEQLGEEQKQILFIKMREEQIRKWRLYEAEMERQEMETLKTAGKEQRTQNGRRVQWLRAADGNEWVWVMGEHPQDLSIEQILENESREKARHMAEKEIMQTLRKAEDLPNSLKREEQFLKAELARIELNSGQNAERNQETKVNSHSPYDDLNDHEHEDSNRSPMPVNFPLESNDGGSIDEQQEIYDNYLLPTGIKSEKNATKLPPLSELDRPNGQIQNDRSKPPPVPEKPAYLRRTVTNPIENSGGMNNGSPKLGEHTIRSYIPNSEMARRQTKILEELNEDRKRLREQAEEEATREQQHWEEQERKARQADEIIRKIAQNAREQHRKCLRTSDSLLAFQKSAADRVNGTTTQQSVREALRGLARPPKPKSRQTIIQWFRSSELDLLLQPSSGTFPPWFHGIISRQQAERLLEGRREGSFLVRITERIFGYAMSYKASDGTTKNYLIERIPGVGYQFLGTNQLVHQSLNALIDHHQSAPITAKGGEILQEPVQFSSATPCDGISPMDLLWHS